MEDDQGSSRGPSLLAVMRERIRLKHYSIRTEEAYLLWVKRYVRFHGLRHPRELGPEHLEAFLTHLAVDGNVAAATQNQALSALLFLYKEMLTVRNIMTEILTGDRADRTHRLIKKSISPLVDSVPVRTAAQMTMGVSGYAELRNTIAVKAAHMSLDPLSEPAFNKERGKVLERILSERMKALSSAEFQDLLRPAFQEDEWIFLVLGAVTGLFAGTIQLIVGFH